MKNFHKRQRALARKLNGANDGSATSAQPVASFESNIPPHNAQKSGGGNRKNRSKRTKPKGGNAGPSKPQPTSINSPLISKPTSFSNASDLTSTHSSNALSNSKLIPPSDVSDSRSTLPSNAPFNSKLTPP
ncbi:hypothetical protein DL95DRAFT_390335, partial [Leptodontidium sp. 2 PMI_412]